MKDPGSTNSRVRDNERQKRRHRSHADVVVHGKTFLESPGGETHSEVSVLARRLIHQEPRKPYEHVPRLHAFAVQVLVGKLHELMAIVKRRGTREIRAA